MARIVSWLLTPLFLLPCCVAFAQSPTRETADRPVEPAETTKVDATDWPNIHLIDVKHADPIELGEGLSKIFEANIKAGRLAIVCDSRAKRLVIRSSDEDFCALRDLVEKLDTTSQADEGAVMVSPASTQSQPTNFDSYWRTIRQIQDTATETKESKTLLEKLQEAVHRDFDSQQQELRTELAQLRTKMDSLENLLEKREAQKNTIIHRRIQTFLQTVGTLPTKNPLASETAAPSSKSFDERRKRKTPFRTNISLDPDTISAEVTTILQAELLGEEGMQIFLDGKPSSLAETIPFQLSNTADRVEFEIASRNNKRAVVTVKLECEQAGDEFWKRIVFEKIRLDVTQDELDRVSGNQMITKCVYLPKEPGKGLAWLVWDQVDAGADVREKSKELGDLVVTMTIKRPTVNPKTSTGTTTWQHSYGASEQVQSYFTTLVEYCKLQQSLGSHDPRAEESLRKLVTNVATDQEIQTAAKSRQQELAKHIAAQAALSPELGPGVSYLARAMSILVEQGRRGMEQWLASDPKVNSSDQPSNYALPKKADVGASAPSVQN